MVLLVRKSDIYLGIVTTFYYSLAGLFLVYPRPKQTNTIIKAIVLIAFNVPADILPVYFPNIYTVLFQNSEKG